MLTHRLFSATILLTSIGVAVFWDSIIAKILFVFMGIAMVVFAMNEVFDMIEKLGFEGFRKTFIIFSCWFIFNVFFGTKHISSKLLVPEALIIGLLIVISFLHVFRHQDFKKGFISLLVSFGVFLYVCWPLSFLVKIYFSSSSMFGPYMMLFLILGTKMGDVGGYAFGMISYKVMGKNNKMVPRLSPGKSWEGYIGSLVFSTLACFILIKLFNGYDFEGIRNGVPYTKKSILTVWMALPLGMILGTIGLMGDLAESVLKRASGVKDSGKLLPGMGGMMDVLDSLILVSPLFYAFLSFTLGWYG